jgi:nucleotide-binding universal stress UspA family protein
VYDTILLPTDGSEGAETALDHALELAGTYGSTLHVLFVVNTTYLGSGAAEATTTETLRSTGERIVEEAVERAAERDIDVVGETRNGDPYTQILDYADETGSDLIVMGTHGRSGLDRYLLGSVTEKVVRTADAPVLTVRAPDADE